MVNSILNSKVTVQNLNSKLLKFKGSPIKILISIQILQSKPIKNWPGFREKLWTDKLSYS